MGGSREGGVSLREQSVLTTSTQQPECGDLKLALMGTTPSPI